MTRYKITIEYDGKPFIGWQRQPDGLSVQGQVERAIFSFSGEQVKVFCASRTDRGVHALGQVAHFDLQTEAQSYVVNSAINFHLKGTPISTLDCELVSMDFHARFSAKVKTYLYRILNRRSKPSIDRGRVWWVPNVISEERMREGSLSFIGTHDFTTFRSGRCRSGSPVRTIDNLSVSRSGHLVEIKFEARSFLHNQVRNMVGTLKLVGEGKLEPTHVLNALLARERRLCWVKAPAEGLYLVHVSY